MVSRRLRGFEQLEQAAARQPLIFEHDEAFARVDVAVAAVKDQELALGTALLAAGDGSAELGDGAP